RNLASTQPIEEHPVDKLVLEQFPINTPYGCCIDRGSNITIVGTSNYAEAAIGTFAYYLAEMGGFNYVSKEVDLDPLHPISFYNIANEQANEHLVQFLGDINHLAIGKNKWVIFLLSASGGQEPAYPTQFHYIIGKEKGDETYNDPRITIEDITRFDALYKQLSTTIEQQFGLQSDCQQFHNGTSDKNIARHIDCPNAFTIRIAWSVTCWDYRYLQIAQTMTEQVKQILSK
ncbi:MAG: ion transporter, partial [Paludibacteraceae bacterium]|nr:ion transporter [Paludibacteraceae bacterium]